MRKIVSIIVFLFYLSVTWKITGEIWDRFVPLSWKTNLMALLLVPFLIGLSMVLSSLTLKWSRTSRS